MAQGKVLTSVADPARGSASPLSTRSTYHAANAIQEQRSLKVLHQCSDACRAILHENGANM